MIRMMALLASSQHLFFIGTQSCLQVVRLKLPSGQLKVHTTSVMCWRVVLTVMWGLTRGLSRLIETSSSPLQVRWHCRKVHSAIPVQLKSRHCNAQDLLASSESVNVHKNWQSCNNVWRWWQPNMLPWRETQLVQYAYYIIHKNCNL